MSVNNVAFDSKDVKSSGIIKEIFKACLYKDVVPIKIGNEEFTCILSVNDVDVTALENLTRKMQCGFSISTGILKGTTISVGTCLISSL